MSPPPSAVTDEALFVRNLSVAFPRLLLQLDQPASGNREHPFRPLDPSTISEPVIDRDIPPNGRCKSSFFFRRPGQLFGPKDVRRWRRCALPHDTLLLCLCSTVWACLDESLRSDKHRIHCCGLRMSLVVPEKRHTRSSIFCRTFSICITVHISFVLQSTCRQVSSPGEDRMCAESVQTLYCICLSGDCLHSRIH
jgi:hypothetical protein